MLESQKKWCGKAPEKCQLCGEPIVESFTDGRTIHGPWAFMCDDCHDEQGVGLGTGKGQYYKRENGAFVKVEG